MSVNLLLKPTSGGDYVRAGLFPDTEAAMKAGARECAAGSRYEGFAVREAETGALVNETSFAAKTRFLPRRRFDLAGQVAALGADSLLPGFGKTPKNR